MESHTFRRFGAFAWFVLFYNVLVILWGAFVRASGSGAGCGSHWPLCNGDVIPRAPEIETLVEFSHRLTSGLALVFVLAMVGLAWRLFPRRHHVRVAAGLSLFFIVTEALVGAGLVLFSLVADNASIARALFMAVHLTNTFLLLTALTLTAWWATYGKPPQPRGQGAALWLLLLAGLAMLLVGASGGVAALGDTLFPSGSLAEGLREDFSPTAHFLIRLRIFHPVLAIGGGLFLAVVANIVRLLRPGRGVQRFAYVVTALVVTQLALGALNVVLLAPIWMQLAHLLLADLVWIALVLLAASALVEQPAPEGMANAAVISPSAT